MFFKRFIVKQKTRVVLLKNGKLFRVLEPGVHVVFLSPFANWKTELHNLRNPAFRSSRGEEMFDGKSDLMRKYFHVIETNDSELAMISVNGTLHQVLLPARQTLIWKDGNNVEVEYVDFLNKQDSSETMIGTMPLQNTQLEKQLSALDDSTTATLLERALGHEDIVQTRHRNS